MDSFQKILEEATPRTVLRQNLKFLDPQKTPAVLTRKRKREEATTPGKKRDIETLKRLQQGWLTEAFKFLQQGWLVNP